MTGNRKTMMDIIGLIQHFRAGDSNRAISRTLSMHRDTVRKYRQWAQNHRLIEAENLPSYEIIQSWLETAEGQKRPTHMVSTVEPYRVEVTQWRKEKISIKAIWQRLQKRGYLGSYGSVLRFVQRLEADKNTRPIITRIERPPGEEAQIDFGYAGKLKDEETGLQKKTWMFVMTLSWSRHQYVEFVTNQKVATWLGCHRRAFAFLGGVPQRLVIDNLKAAIVKASFETPQVQLAYRECAEHYGFLIAPCRPYTPQHKGKVERAVGYVRSNFLGTFEGQSRQEANREVLRWCREVAGRRRHGTTKEQPLERFEQTEKALLMPLPAEPYDMAVWKKATTQRDGYVSFEQAYYSLPHRYVGQPMMVRGCIDVVRIYTMSYQLVTTHTRARKAGERCTKPDHIPKTHRPGILLTRPACLELAQELGPATTTVVTEFLSARPIDQVPTVRRLLLLHEKYSRERLENACRRAQDFGDVSYKTIKRILENELDVVATSIATPLVQPTTTPLLFVRPADEILGEWVEAAQWT